MLKFSMYCIGRVCTAGSEPPVREDQGVCAGAVPRGDHQQDQRARLQQDRAHRTRLCRDQG